jgi:RNA polymerase sigma-70 factor (ECF subfamily)
MTLHMPAASKYACGGGEVPAAHSRETAAPHARITTRQLFVANAGFILRLVRNLGVPASDAEDVTQEVFMIAHRRLATLQLQANPRNWLYGIARRLAANHVAKLKRRGGQSIEDRDAVTQMDPAGQLQRDRERELLQSAMERLDDKKREVFVLFELEGLAMQEVAEVVDCPLHTAYSRLYKARAIVQRGVLAAGQWWVR